ncbi:MAG TPA: helix-turn-helix transcriptional regulator [Microbacterium sp.]|nr:helix-turn-helix transcriptional regulator [Microbacterium sp.]
MTKQTSPAAVTSRIADEVRAEMARQKKTGAELAAVLGITQHTVGRRLNGATPFNMIELILVAAWLGISLGELIRRAETPLAVAS